LINPRDVIRLKIPFPDINALLAKQAHMYICSYKEIKGKNIRKFVKCQTLKPYMLQNNTIEHFIDELPNATRNPFLHATRIDCDKLFKTENLQFDVALRTTVRTDICVGLMQEIESKLKVSSVLEYMLGKTELLRLNPLVKEIIADCR